MNATHFFAAFVLVLALPMSAIGASGTAGTVAVKLRPFTTEYRAYAQVEPRTTLTIKAATSGEIVTLSVTPGQHIRAGEPVAKLVGPEYQAALSTARSQFRAAQMALRTAKHNYPDFSSALDVENARAALQQAHAALTRIQAAGEVRAPLAGTVLSLNASPGERVSPGTPLLNLLPDHNLWLRTTLFGLEAQRLRPGMAGKFYPLEGGAAIPVRVSAIIPPLTPGGGLGIACLATVAAAWQDGEVGTVIVTAGPARQMPVVPTAALILDQGKWWVLIANAHGLHRQRVEIGSSAGEWTFIPQGLRAGEQVVALNAYLLFHADISQHYAPPD